MQQLRFEELKKTINCIICGGKKLKNLENSK